MKEKEDLIDRVDIIVGAPPPGLRYILTILAHPDVIEYTKRYIAAMDVASHCTNYTYPWSCIREAEARYKNIKYGWLGGAGGIGLDESWCENCRKKVLDE